MRRLLLAALLALLAVGPAHADAIDDYVARQMANGHIPGLALAVVRDGEVVTRRVYGVADLAWDAVVTPDTRFQIASTTKALTGALLMLLVQEGTIDLDAPVARYLPDAPAAWGEITVRHLATHSSGLAELPGGAGAAPDSIDETYAAIAALPPVHPPGAGAAYGNSDFVVLAHLLGKVTGRPFPELLRSRLLDPLGMAATAWDDAADQGPVRRATVLPRRSAVYEWRGETQGLHWFRYPPSTYAGGGLFASINDLARFATALDRGAPLTPATQAAMAATRPLADGRANSFAIGWLSGLHGGRPTLSHSGGPALGDLLRFPGEKVTVIVLQNQRHLVPYLARGVADLVLAPKPAPPPAAIDDPDPARTAALRALVVLLGQGTVDRDRFTPEAREQFLPDLERFVLPFYRSLPAPASFVLTSLRPLTYAADQGLHRVTWTFELAADGRVVSLDGQAE